ncbi:hypothetical protein B296_00027416 [Ensete ventricosum]|uniref:Uncharacterized protein n=1 Tax=Ensete ventricosum TaxID=4639 RepID=A0A426Y3G2_ENSVE|nr:hypothetical protein B296_00027416 [Ensete ventricosum]
MIGAQCNSDTKPTFRSCWYNVWAIWNPILEILPGYLDWKGIDKDSHSGKLLTLDHFEFVSILWSVVAIFNIKPCEHFLPFDDIHASFTFCLFTVIGAAASALNANDGVGPDTCFRCALTSV